MQNLIESFIKSLENFRPDNLQIKLLRIFIAFEMSLMMHILLIIKKFNQSFVKKDIFEMKKLITKVFEYEIFYNYVILRSQNYKFYGVKIDPLVVSSYFLLEKAVSILI